MKIRTKFRLGIGLVIVSATVIGVVTVWAYLKLERIQEQVAYGGEIRAQAVNLSVLTSELLLHPSARVDQQWIGTQQSLREVLDNPPRLGPFLVLLSREVNERMTLVTLLHDRLFGEEGPGVTADPTTDAATRLRYTRILSQVAALISLTERIDDHLHKTQQDVIQSVVITLAVSALAVFAGSAFIQSYLVPTLVKPILQLRSTIQSIGAGRLDQDVPSPSEDEIGDVYKEVDRMRQSLLSSTQQLQEANRELSESKVLLEKRVEERTAANEELEAFTYSVSHDLRAPLRGMAGFCQALVEDYGDKLDETGRDYVHRVSAASMRMGQLIDDLLTLSRVTRKEVKRSEVDLSRLAGTIFEQLQQRDPERQVECRVQPGMTAQGDETLLHTVLENLLENAWKYSARQAYAIIEFGSTANGAEPTYFVRDNGAGFDMAYADKLFKPFQRLHNSTDFEGTGIGLASAANIIRRHGGRISADSKPGAGTTMEFTLSK